MRERDEHDDQPTRDAAAERDRPALGVVDGVDVSEDAIPGAGVGDDAAVVFESGGVEPALVEASVDALFEEFEEDTPEEVMLAARYPSVEDVVPDPPAFDEFAVDVEADDASPDDASPDDASPDDAFLDEAFLGEPFLEDASITAASVPDAADVVGFEDAPEPDASEHEPAAPLGGGSEFAETSGVADATERGELPSQASVPSDAAASGGFEWVDDPVDADDATTVSDPGDGTPRRETGAEPVARDASESSLDEERDVPEDGVVETVLADPSVASTFAAGSSEGVDRESVFSRLRSSFPF